MNQPLNADQPESFESPKHSSSRGEMSSLSKKLAQFQENIKKENARDERQELEQLTLAELQKAPIAVGKS